MPNFAATKIKTASISELGMQLFQFESYKKGIVLSTIFNILNKGLVFLSSLVVAFYFGTQLKTDIFFSRTTLSFSSLAFFQA